MIKNINILKRRHVLLTVNKMGLTKKNSDVTQTSPPCTWTSRKSEGLL
jgi:hypothetical protein